MFELYNSKKREYQELVDEAFSILQKNNEWEKRYSGYINEILNDFHSNEAQFIQKVVRIDWPMALYLRITDMKKSGIYIDIRLLGTSIATLILLTSDFTQTELSRIREGNFTKEDVEKGKNNVVISFKAKENSLNKVINKMVAPEFLRSEKWDNDLLNRLVKEEKERGWNWHSSEIKAFRIMIQQAYKENAFKASDEHAHESTLLHIMDGNSKYFSGIRPVLLEKAYFQMPTPFMASKAKNGELKYAGINGGGIDILARKRLGAKNEICVIELKDKYEKGEEPIKAIRQAVVYSVFIMCLLNSSKADGDKWYKYFGFTSAVDDLTINAVICMPFKSDNHFVEEKDDFFKKMQLKVGNLGTIKLHFIYYDERILYSKDYCEDDILVSFKSK